jgi:hypothetical protein
MTTATETTHPFERAGLGAAPYRFVGHSESKWQAAPGCPVKPGSSCDYCAQAIVDCYWFRSADGKRFKVGCDCCAKASKAYGKPDAALSHAERQAKMVQSKRRREQTAKRNGSTVEALDAILADHSARDRLAAMPHPKADRGEFFSKQNALDNAEWMRKNAGAAGRKALLKSLRAVLAAAG